MNSEIKIIETSKKVFINSVNQITDSVKSKGWEKTIIVAPSFSIPAKTILEKRGFECRTSNN